jgi:hypothetical protein
MNQVNRRIPVLVVLLATLACTRSPLLVGDRIEITKSPNVVRFEKPVRRTGSMWEMCFEFNTPRESHRADGIRAVLLAASGERRPVVDVELDRRGESVVCHLGRVDAGEREVFEAVELSSPVDLHLRGIRGGSY